LHFELEFDDRLGIEFHEQDKEVSPSALAFRLQRPSFRTGFAFGAECGALLPMPPRMAVSRNELKASVVDFAISNTTACEVERE
jgi:hypothetical protein